MAPGEQGIATKESDMLQQELAFWQGKAAKLKLLGEHETYEWEYRTCLEKIALFQRLLDKRQEVLLRFSSTKSSP